MMTDTEMIQWMYNFYDGAVCAENYENCTDCNKYNECYAYAVIPRIAGRFEELMVFKAKYEHIKKMYEDLTNDHYIDMCEFYYDENEKLQSENEQLRKDLKKALCGNNFDEIIPCDMCKNHVECKGKDCDFYEEGCGMTDENGKYLDMKWSCLDFDFGTCRMMAGSPCKNCDFKNNWVYDPFRQK